MSLEQKLAQVLINTQKAHVSNDLNILKATKPKPSQKSENIDDEKIKKLVEFRQSIPEENLAIYRKELERANARLSYLDYLRYTIPGFIPTKFHRFLATVIQDTVEKIEHGGE